MKTATREATTAPLRSMARGDACSAAAALNGYGNAFKI